VSDVHERLRRLLFLVPYISKHPGISVEELARALSLTRDQLLKELDLLTMVGRPPFQPDDYIDIYVENDRVYVDLDQRFSAPPRLTAAEATALTAAAELLKPAAGGALQSALAKLEKVLPAEVRSRYRDMERKIDANVQGSDELAPLAKAISSRREVTFAYFSQGRGAVEQRRARPLELFSHRGQWYLHAYCLSRKDHRLFRLDRIRDLALTSTPFELGNAARPTVPNPAGAAGEVKVRFSPVSAPYVRERFGQTVRTMPDGGAEVNVAGDSERWLVQWILSFGGEAEVLEPEWAREAVARAANSVAPKAG
jgi:proteasome accessory factor C